MKTKSEPFTIAAFEAGLKDNQWVETRAIRFKFEVISTKGRKTTYPIIGYKGGDLVTSAMTESELLIITEVQPREWWVLSDGLTLSIYNKKDDAIDDKLSIKDKIIHVREVIEDNAN